MPVNDVTTNRSYQKPNIANTLSDDVGRLRSALDAIDTDMASKAPSAGPTFTGVATVAAGSAAAPSLTFTGATSDTGLYAPGADQLAISTAGTGRLFVDSSGRILVNDTTSRLSGYSKAQYLQISTAQPGSDFIAGFRAYSADNIQPVAVFGKSRNSSIGSHTAVNAGDGLGSILFEGSDGTEFQRAATIDVAVDAAPAGTSVPGRIVFSTTPSGSRNPTERLRITSDGKVGIGTSSPEATLDCRGSIISSNGTTRYAVLGTDTDGAYLGTAGLAHPLIFKNGNGSTDVERARIDSSGRLLVGTSSSTADAIAVFLGRTSALGGTGGEIKLAHPTANVPASGTLGRIQFGNTSDARGAEISAIAESTWAANDYPTYLAFSTTADGAATPTEAMRINNQRELLIGTTTRTANGGVLQISNGITFPGTQSACSDPNTLDDYEEGSWTPVINGSSTAGTGTYSVQSGAYTKIGNRVIAHARITWSAHTGTGNILIAGLPFSSNATANTECAFSLWYSDLTYPASSTVTATSVPASTTIALYSVASGATFSNLALDTAAAIIISGAYLV